MHQDDRPQGFLYRDHRTVDGKHGIITDTLVTPGNVHDSQPYIGQLKRQWKRFSPETVAASVDAGVLHGSIVSPDAGDGHRAGARLPSAE